MAELTGEIPALRTGEIPADRTGEIAEVRTGEIPAVRAGEKPADRTDEIPARGDELLERADLAATNGTARPVAEPAEVQHDYYELGDERAEHPDDYEADLDNYDDYLESIRGPRPAGVRPEQMRPDPVDEDELGGVAVDEHLTGGLDTAGEEDHEPQDLPSYLRTEQATLFSGHTVADHLARGRSDDVVTKAPSAEDEVAVAAEPLTPMDKAMRGGLIVLQSIIAVAFGAGLFMAFDELWKWNNIVAMVLAVLVILGLVVAVRLVRKTEDIASTLIAVVVGALVTFGPLALLQPN